MKKTLFIILAVAIGLASCKKNSLVIEGRVYNQKTMEPLSGVKVTLKTDTEKKVLDAKTNSDGFYSLGEVMIGEYIIKLQKDSFLAELATVGLSGTTYIISDVIMKQTISTITYLDPLSEKMEFNVYKRYKGMYEQSVVNQPFKVYLSPAMEAISATTNAYGYVELENLPSSSTIVIEFNFTDNGILYEQSFNLFPGSGTTSLTIDGYVKGGDLGIVTTNVLDDEGMEIEDFVIIDNVTITFTQPIDTTADNISLLRGGFVNVASVDGWSNNNMTYTISPETILDLDTYYTLNIGVTNEDNTNSYFNSITFKTQEGLK